MNRWKHTCAIVVIKNCKNVFWVPISKKSSKFHNDQSIPSTVEINLKNTLMIKFSLQTVQKVSEMHLPDFETISTKMNAQAYVSAFRQEITIFRNK